MSMNRDELHKRLIEVAAQSPARKRKVGAIIMQHYEKDGVDMFTEGAVGYNHNMKDPTGPCEDENGETLDDVIHAEVDAINRIPQGLSRPLKMYTTHPPCEGCRAALKAADIDFEVMGDFLKFDTGKPRMALVPASLGIEVGKVVTYGAKKYKVNNWRKVKSQEPYINALERHIAAYKKGELNDPESGLSHMSHIACNAAFLLELSHLPLIDEEK